MTIGNDRENFHALGLAPDEVKEEIGIVRELPQFLKHKIMSIHAGRNTSFVYIEGEKNALEGIQMH